LRKEKRERELAEKMAREKKEERERWWSGAELEKEYKSQTVRSDIVICDDDGTQLFPRPKESHDGSNNYHMLKKITIYSFGLLYLGSLGPRRPCIFGRNGNTEEGVG
jgi:hypothetical protein